MKGFMYILECSDGSYYTGSTKDLELRISQHQNGEGANHTKKRLPVKLLYFEEFDRIDKAFYREKQVQGWSRKKKEALMKNMPEELHELAKCLNDSSHVGFGSAQPTGDGAAFGSAQSAGSGFAEAADNNENDKTIRDRSLSVAEMKGNQPNPTNLNQNK